MQDKSGYPQEDHALLAPSKALRVSSDAEGHLSVSSDNSLEGFELDLGSPMLSAFEIQPDGQGRHYLAKALPSSASSPDSLAYVGEIDGSLYLLPANARSLIDSIPAFEEQNALALTANRAKCVPGSAIFPGCLVGLHRVSGLIQGGASQVQNFADIVANASFVLFSGILGLVAIYFFWNNSKRKSGIAIGLGGDTDDQKDPIKGLQNLQVSDIVLGVGSHGTVVYQGTFEGRQVAIKRLLIEFFQVADHEVRILQESDYHPNVVRYYYKESSQGFMYLALELCPASLYDIMEKKDEEFVKIRQVIDPKVAVYQILSGIQHLHNLKIVHRDIKPQVSLH